MNLIDEIFSQVATLDREKRKLFYFKLGFNLTISTRSFSHDPRYSDFERLEGVKNINELMHRNFNWLWRLMYSGEVLPEDSHMLEEVKHYCKLYPKSSGEIRAAIRSSYDYLGQSGIFDK